MHSVQTQIQFEAAHRLYNVATYSAECRENLHGHSYKVDVVVTRPELNEAAMVCDFKQLKTICKEEIEDKYDHSCILVAEDPIAEIIWSNCKKVHLVDENPTAEWMAKHFSDILQTRLYHIDDKLNVEEVRVQETANNIATYKRGV